MKNLNVSQPRASPAPRFPELSAWKDRTTSMASSELEGCSGPYGWCNYGISHDDRLEVDAGGEAIFIFTEYEWTSKLT